LTRQKARLRKLCQQLASFVVVRVAIAGTLADGDLFTDSCKYRYR